MHTRTQVCSKPTDNIAISHLYTLEFCPGWGQTLRLGIVQGKSHDCQSTQALINFINYSVIDRLSAPFCPHLRIYLHPGTVLESGNCTDREVIDCWNY